MRVEYQYSLVGPELPIITGGDLGVTPLSVEP
jgi:hypothetical protein